MDLKKQRLTSSLEPIIGEIPEDAASQDINFDKLTEMLKNEEGCHIYGIMNAKKVTGYLYFNDRRLDHIPANHQIKRLDFSHRINHFSFGKPTDIRDIKKHYNKLLNPLDGVSKVIKSNSPGTLFQYYLNVVPIKFIPQFARTIPANQYTANSHQVDSYHRNQVVIK